MTTPGAERPPFTVGIDDDYRDPDIYGPHAGADVHPETPTPHQVAQPPTDPVYGPGPATEPRTAGTQLDPDDGSDTPLEEIRRDLDTETVPTTTLPIPGRPGWEAIYRIDIRSGQIDSWRKRAKRGRTVNATMFAALCLSETNTGLYRQGRPIRLDGEEQTFRDRPLMGALGVGNRIVDGVLKVYGLEGHVDAAARAVLRDAGWGDELENLGEDPTG